MLLNKKEIKNLTKYSKLTIIQQEMHYLQTLVLLGLDDSELVFKGGTYLWFCHGLNRFSEDLDFTLVGKLDKKFIDKLVENLSFYGVEAKTKKIYDNDKSCSFELHLKGPLYEDNPRTVCSIYVDISKREKTKLDTLPLTVSFPYYTLPAKIVRGMNLDEVFAEKIRAVLTRDKPRDIYDLYFLIQKGIKPNMKLINMKLSFDNKIFDINEFKSKLKKQKDSYNKELEPLIIGKLPESDLVINIIINSFK